MITSLRGVNFRPAEAKEVVANMDETNELRIERDPENAYDRNAIRVIDIASDEFIGFVAKEDAVTLAPRMDTGEVFTCVYNTRDSKYGVYLKIDEAEVEIDTDDAHSPDSEVNDDYDAA